MNLGVQINLNFELKMEKNLDWNIFDYIEFNHKDLQYFLFIERKKMVCLITLIDFLFIQPFMRPLFSGQQELSNLDYYFQDGWKTGAQTNQRFWKLNNIFWWSKVSHIIIKGWNFMIKSFYGQVVFCFAMLRAISAYVGENWLSQYMIACCCFFQLMFYVQINTFSVKVFVFLCWSSAKQRIMN